MKNVVAPISFDEAVAKVTAFLQDHMLTDKEKKEGRTKVTIYTWGFDGKAPNPAPFVGVRVAEISVSTRFTNGNIIGSSYMQRDMPDGIAFCAQAERCIIQLMEGNADANEYFIEEEFEKLKWLIDQDVNTK